MKKGGEKKRKGGEKKRKGGEKKKESGEKKAREKRKGVKDEEAKKEIQLERGSNPRPSILQPTTYCLTVESYVHMYASHPV